MQQDPAYKRVSPVQQQPSGMPCHRYTPFRPVDLPDRTWPTKSITQAREDLIERSVQSLVGARMATVHLYNATAPIFRKVVFRIDREECKALGVEGTRHVMKYAEHYLDGTDFGYEYSPEIFMDTELDFALDVCEGVMDVWQPGPGREIILNLPCTVERSTPNVYADQLEWMSRNLARRERVCLSVHTHNDRGT